jgi:universal stress protein A
MEIRTILCPIDYSDVSAHELDLAIEVGRTFGARLVVHHNRTAIAPGLGRQWDWEATHQTNGYTEAEAERRMQAVLNEIPAELRAEGIVSTGAVGMALLALAEQLPADLVVLGSHGWSTDDHASVAERVIARAPCPVLIFNKGTGAPERFRLGTGGAEAPHVVVPTDFSPTAQHAVAYACALARVLPLRLQFLHVLPAGEDCSVEAVRAAEARFEATLPAGAAGQVTFQVRSGSATDAILAYLATSRPAFAVLGEHSHDVVRRHFTRDTARAVVHEARCPIWIVPARAAV